MSLSLVITFVLSSCKNDDDVIIQEEERAQTVSPAEKNDDVYSLDEAEELATRFYSNLRSSNVKLRSGGKQKPVLSQTFTTKAMGNINLYIFNYQKGGFVIINPIKKMNERILAFSENEAISENELNSGQFSLWKDYTMEYLSIKASEKEKMSENVIRKNKIKLHTVKDKDIERILNSKLSDLSPDEVAKARDYLASLYEEKNITQPIIKTNWHQDFPYNDNCPHHYPAGCVAISVGQILNHYRKWDGESWNWDKVNRSERPEISRFIRTVGSGVKMTYHKGGSYPDWANFNLIKNLNYREEQFLKKIGYNNVKSYNLPEGNSTLLNELNKGYPVIMSGFKKQIIIPLDGHSWIADGLRMESYHMFMHDEDAEKIAARGYDSLPIGEFIIKYDLYYCHLNMGWGDSSNTWYYTCENSDLHGLRGIYRDFQYRTHIKFLTVRK